MSWRTVVSVPSRAEKRFSTRRISIMAMRPPESRSAFRPVVPAGVVDASTRFNATPEFWLLPVRHDHISIAFIVKMQFVFM